VDVISNEAFFDFVEDLERLEELESGKFEVGKDVPPLCVVESRKLSYSSAGTLPHFLFFTTISAEIRATGEIGCLFPVSPHPGERLCQRHTESGESAPTITTC
jgi:hypothetical protein